MLHKEKWNEKLNKDYNRELDSLQKDLIEDMIKSNLSLSFNPERGRRGMPVQILLYKQLV